MRNENRFPCNTDYSYDRVFTLGTFRDKGAFGCHGRGSEEESPTVETLR